MSRTTQRAFAVLLLAVVLLIQPETGARSGPLDVFSVDPLDAQTADVRTIVFPVAGESSYGNTFGACRDGCSRTHQGVDIFAPKLTPLIAAVDGTIVAERRNATGKPGNKIVLADADGWRYRYFHVNNDSPGSDDNSNPQGWIFADDLRIGDQVRAGQVVGYLGDSGNAEETPPHLHFEIAPPGGAPIDPTLSVTAAQGRGQSVPASDVQASPSLQAEWHDVIDDWYDQVVSRQPTESERDAWANRLALSLGSEADLVADLALSAPFREPEGIALRAYVAAFERLPTAGALKLLAEEVRDGGDELDVSQRITTSVDYRTSAVALDTAGLADLTAAPDVKHETWPLFLVVRAYSTAQGRMPDADEVDAWTEYLDDGGLFVDVVAGALDDELPTGPPRGAGYGPSELGYEPGVNVRQGPVDLVPAGDPGEATFAQAGTARDAEVDFELNVEDNGDGSDTANLTVRIPLDELIAASGGEAELTVELSLTQAEDPDDPADADAAVDLVIIGDGSGSGADPTDRSTTTTTPPPVSVPRPTTTRRPATTTTTAKPATTTTTTTSTTTSSSSTTTTVCDTTTTTDPSSTTSTTGCDTTTTTTAAGDTTTTTTCPTDDTGDSTTSTTEPCTTDDSTTTTAAADSTTSSGSTTTTTTTAADSTTSSGSTTTTTTAADSTTSSGSTTTTTTTSTSS